MAHHSSPDHSGPENPGTRTLDPETSLGSTQIAQSQDIPSQIRAEVTGMYLNPDYLMSR